MDRFRGSAPARLDDKGRLKVPNVFRAQIEEAFGRELFVTSISGRNFLLYPLGIWRGLEEKIWNVFAPSAIAAMSMSRPGV